MHFDCSVGTWINRNRYQEEYWARTRKNTGLARKRLELGDDRGFRSQGGSTANLFERGERILMDVVRVLRRVPLTDKGLAIEPGQLKEVVGEISQADLDPGLGPC